jgi:D-alanyl-D-alanine carboxypeptidase/D-alanyl-D-alanine-endopeptidase (penicillin-binding protein 4)
VKLANGSTLLLGSLGLLSSLTSLAQSNDSLAVRIDRIMSRQEFVHADFGIEFYALDTHRVVYSLNANKLFIPASTTKLLTEGTVLARLGADFRFHTKVYRSGPVDSNGRLKGDLVLVAAGDPNLSNRIQPDGTLSFADNDHAYGGPPVSGDPLAVIKELAAAVRAKGIRRIDGRVLVDPSLFPDGRRENGSGTVLSSIIVNDNLIDTMVTPGKKPGDPLTLHVAPQTSYAHFVNQMTTTAAGAKPSLDDPIVAANPDGTITVTLSGGIPAESTPQPLPVPVPSPTRFATTVLREALRAADVTLAPTQLNAQFNHDSLKHFYNQENLVAEHISTVLSEELKVTLKLSQNLHADIGQYLLGAYLGHDTKNPDQIGFEIEHTFLTEAQLDLSGASQGDGAGGDWADLFSPDFSAAT